jgi:thiosulfate/3-mercaptopyruvate sulfurtransferase
VNALVTTDWLAGRLEDPGARVVDCRWSLDPSRSGRKAYAAGHLPGAVFLDIDTDLSAPGGRRGGPLGRHPWPSADQVARVMGTAGIGPGVRVVAYDDQAGAHAARLWYLLRAYGHDEVAVLDGGFVKWLADGYPTTTVVPSPSPVVFTPRPRAGFVVTKDDLARPEAGRLVLDARAPDRYRGDAEPIDPRAGHVPGARNAPYTANLTSGPAPVFRSPDDLRAHYASLGADRAEPVVYCGSGITACHDLLALHLAGLPGRLYAGSWSEWSADASLPVETGH